ncbi:MAG: transketolase [Patescibacteria group bacterium]|nr:transketolase [Patescibacteria group bacterium]
MHKFSKNYQKIKILKQISKKLRIDVIKMIGSAGSGHPAGSLGMADIFAALYFGVLNHDPTKPEWDKRDFVFLSNGHICPILYAALAHAGYFEKKLLETLRKIDSPLQGHPHYGSLPGIENTSGSLGQGISQACGFALSLKMDHKSNQIYCLMSDGEQQEGETWEAYLLAAKYELNNLTVIIDRNQTQIQGMTEEVMPLNSLKNKLESFKWQVEEIDGHNFSQILKAMETAKNQKQPLAIIANTTPGKGVKFMENDHRWHGKAPNQKQIQEAITQLKQ